MFGPRLFAFALLIVVSLASSSSCTADTDDGPTQDDMQEVATEACEQWSRCGVLPDGVSLEQCIANQVGSYQDAPECLAIYYYNECQTMLTCEELETLNELFMGLCLDEFEEARKVTCAP